MSILESNSWNHFLQPSLWNSLRRTHRYQESHFSLGITSSVTFSKTRHLESWSTFSARNNQSPKQISSVFFVACTGLAAPKMLKFLHIWQSAPCLVIDQAFQSSFYNLSGKSGVCCCLTFNASCHLARGVTKFSSHVPFSTQPIHTILLHGGI